MAETMHVQPYYDPFDFDIDDDPYPVWKQLRDRAPLCHHDRYGFYTLSRRADVTRGRVTPSIVIHHLIRIALGQPRFGALRSER